MLRLSRLTEKARSTAGIDFLDTVRRIPRNRRPRCGGGIGGRQPRLVHRNQRHALEPKRVLPLTRQVKYSFVPLLLAARPGRYPSGRRSAETSQRATNEPRPFSEVARPWQDIRPGKRSQNGSASDITRRTRCTPRPWLLRDEAKVRFCGCINSFSSSSPGYLTSVKLRLHGIREIEESRSSTGIFSYEIYPDWIVQQHVRQKIMANSDADYFRWPSVKINICQFISVTMEAFICYNIDCQCYWLKIRYALSLQLSVSEIIANYKEKKCIIINILKYHIWNIRYLKICYLINRVHINLFFNKFYIKAN